MKCPHCSKSNARRLNTMTNLSYHENRCRDCRRQFNERTGSVFNFIEYPTEIILLVVYHYHRFKLSLDDITELISIKGVHICHQTVQNWAQSVGIEATLKFRKKRRGKVHGKWHVDATYIKVEGRWCYLYRAIDKHGHLVDVMVSDVRDQAAAEKFLRQCEKTTGVTPIQITTDKEAALYAAIAKVFPKALHRDVKYKNKNIESDHCGIKSRYRVMRGFKNPFSALIFCTILRNYVSLFL